ncbi:hypothetical protein KAV67_04575, partial [Candidatus Bipolaricaulota bacterium]|nr:hypothetical protein [Candidatus Bipolaricaulota bacterium]
CTGQAGSNVTNGPYILAALLVRDWLVFERGTGIFSPGLLEKQPVPEQSVPIFWRYERSMYSCV